MRIETPEVKREDGSKFKIAIDVYEYSYSVGLVWRISDVMTKEPRKKNWVSHSEEIENILRYSSIDYKERGRVLQQKLIDFVGEEWAKKAFQYAYDYIKPDILK